MFTKVKGTQDFLDLTLFKFFIDQSQRHFLNYDFTEIAVPILESVALFKRSLGEETDVVSKEMFIIKPAAESKDEICLRPEATASIVRAFVENSVQHAPWKVFTYGPMFRYERPQKGRYRQFHQVSVEVIGSKSIFQDAQLIKMFDRLFTEKCMLQNYVLQINFLGCPEDRKLFKEKLYKFLESKSDQICQKCLERKEKNILRVLDCKIETCQKNYEKAPKITDSLCGECSKEWQKLQETLEILSISFIINSKLVRGLDYYNKTVFEFVSDSLGAQSAFCAGGRYDNLVKEVGAKEDFPSVGAAIGIERMLLLLEEVQDKLSLPQPKVLTVIMPVEEAQNELALLVADELQAHNLCTEVMLEGDSFKSMMRKANKLGAKHVIILGEDEQKNGTLTIKNMLTGTQNVIPQSEVVKYLS
ncbi:MAG: Histidine-tRNA ligase [candidate division TM6 bacterium GW2011_GWF2_32_72]|nr:MAG: Histidine-tRNA ligase [candidate division TM6 bacterium GW2011_GWF2_32_72]